MLLSVRLLHLFQLSEARHEFLVPLLQSFLFCHKAFVFYSNVIDVVRSALKNQHLGRFVIVTEFGNLNAKSLRNKTREVGKKKLAKKEKKKNKSRKKPEI